MGGAAGKSNPIVYTKLSVVLDVFNVIHRDCYIIRIHRWHGAVQLRSIFIFIPINVELKLI